ncbi:MAG: hypothetical protein NC033_05920 [Clostridiales bacterium]|nr:hypothetical protein [Clostridiales bacterium]
MIFIFYIVAIFSNDCMIPPTIVDIFYNNFTFIVKYCDYIALRAFITEF